MVTKFQIVQNDLWQGEGSMSPSTSGLRPPPRGSCGFLCIVPEHVQVYKYTYLPSLHKKEHKYSI